VTQCEEKKSVIGFCAIRHCDHNDHREPCEGTANRWDAEARVSRPGLARAASKFAQKYGKKARLTSYQAHHIASVSCVRVIIAEHEPIRGTVEQTNWCVNEANNMIALPVWAHTISWYVDVTKASRADKDLGAALLDVCAPPFAGLAQHDYDHGPYREEVAEALQIVRDRVAEAASQHKEVGPSQVLADGLSEVIAEGKRQLQERRTHEGWLDGMSNPGGRWYFEFSMARATPTERVFPVRGSDLLQKVFDIRDALAKLPDPVK
jgi:hypothetical protein